MGRGLVRTRSGYETNQQGIHQTSKCKAALKAIVELLRDVVLLFCYTLPGPVTNFRFYCLIMIRMALYSFEGMIIYAMAMTIMTEADEENPGVLIELTRLLLCSAAEQAEARIKREANGSWLDLISNVNQSNLELAEVLGNLIGTTTFSSVSQEHSNNITIVDPNTILGDMISLSSNLTQSLDINTTDNIIQEHSNNITIVDTNTILGDMISLSSNLTQSLDSNTNDNTNINDNFNIMASSLNLGYQFDWCLQVEDLDTDQSTITCISGLSLPICALVTLAMCTTTCGFVLAHLGKRNQVNRPVAEQP